MMNQEKTFAEDDILKQAASLYPKEVPPALPVSMLIKKAEERKLKRTLRILLIGGILFLIAMLFGIGITVRIAVLTGRVWVIYPAGIFAAFVLASIPAAGILFMRQPQNSEAIQKLVSREEG